MRETFRFRVKGRALIALAFWMLVSPMKWVTAVLAAAVIHEMGHLAALWACDIPVFGMEIDIGGAAILTASMEPPEELICALAGPITEMLVCLFWRWYPEAAMCAAVQSVFNLLPVYPMDGGRAIAALRNICCKP